MRKETLEELQAMLLRKYDKFGWPIHPPGTFKTGKLDKNGEEITITIDEIDESKFEPYDSSELYRKSYYGDDHLILLKILDILVKNGRDP